MKIDDRPFKDGMPPMHPGEFLADDLNEMEVTPEEFDTILSVPEGTVLALVEGRRNMDAEMALRLSHYFGTTARIWMELQIIHDLKVAERKHGKAILKQVKPCPPNLMRFPGDTLAQEFSTW